MHLKGIQNKHKVTIAWVLTMQCNAMRLKRKTWLGNHLSSKHRKQAQQVKWIGATILGSIQFNLAWSVSFKKHNQTFLEKQATL